MGHRNGSCVEHSSTRVPCLVNFSTTLQLTEQRSFTDLHTFSYLNISPKFKNFSTHPAIPIWVRMMNFSTILRHPNSRSLKKNFNKGLMLIQLHNSSHSNNNESINEPIEMTSFYLNFIYRLLNFNTSSSRHTKVEQTNILNILTFVQSSIHF